MTSIKREEGGGGKGEGKGKGEAEWKESRTESIRVYHK